MQRSAHAHTRSFFTLGRFSLEERLLRSSLSYFPTTCVSAIIAMSTRPSKRHANNIATLLEGVVKKSRKGQPKAENKVSQPIKLSPEQASKLVLEAQALSLSNPPPGMSKEFWEPLSKMLFMLSQVVEGLTQNPSPAVAPTPVQADPPPANHPPPRGVGPSTSGVSSYEDHLRMRSIVIAGLAEDASLSASQKIKADQEAVQELLCSLEVEVKPSNVYRMGKVNEDGKPRLIKVVLPASTFYRKALKNASKLKGMHEYEKVFIRKSMTKEERAAFAEERKTMYQLRLLHGKDCPFVLYRDQVWLRSEIKSGKRSTIPQLPVPSENMHQ